MKNIVTTILILMILSSFMLGQNLGLSLHKFGNNKESDRFLLQNHKELKNTNNKGIMYKPLVIAINDNTNRHTYSYDSYGRVTTELWEKLDSGVWLNSNRTTYTYDLIGNILVCLNEIRDIVSGGWINSERYSYTYSSTSKTYKIETFKNGAWQNYSLYTYTYDINGDVQKLLGQGWSNGWVNEILQSYLYDENGNIVSLIEEFWDTPNNNWGNRYRLTYTYDIYNNPLTNLLEFWQNGSWLNNYRESQTYDEFGNGVTWLVEQWENGDWVNQRRSFATYDSHNNMTTVLSENWGSGVWSNSYRSTYTYDLMDNLLTKLSESWTIGLWVNDSRETYTYDITSNAVTGKAEKWENNAWVNNQYGSLTLTSNYKNNNLYVSGYNCNVTYTQFTDVKDELNNSLVFALNQNYPNPFNPSTNINFTLPKTEFVTLKIYDILGKEITTLINEELNAGNHTKIWDAKNLSSGVYFYKLQAGKFTETKKMVLVR